MTTSSSISAAQVSKRLDLPSRDPFAGHHPQAHVQSESDYDRTIEALRAALRHLEREELPGKDDGEAYLRHLARRNRRPRTLAGNACSLVLFLGMLRDSGKTALAEVTKGDMESFIEHEQDREMKVTTIRTRLACVRAFLRYMVEEGVVSGEVFARRIRLHLPDRLPRAMDPDDTRRLLASLDDVRKRVMVLLLLRTGLRIGELLNVKMLDLHLAERRMEIYEGEKNRLGRVVYLSDDAITAVQDWIRVRDPGKEYLLHGRQNGRMCYSTARAMFVQCLAKAGLTGKGYTVHTLRHTFATDLLNAGMRLECLQVLLGHRCIEETRRYARLTDKTREEEYFRAMAKIEEMAGTPPHFGCAGETSCAAHRERRRP